MKSKEKMTPERHVSFDSTNHSKADDLAYFRSRSLTGNSKAHQELKTMPLSEEREGKSSTIEVRVQTILVLYLT